jgi:hypothetical protein
MAPSSNARSSDGPAEAGEQRGSPDMDVAVIAGATFPHRAVTYYDVNGVAIVEGDIALGPVDKVRDTTERTREALADGVAFSVGLPGSQFRWPNHEVPYEVDPGLPNQERVAEAIALWEANTPFRFPQRTPANADHYHNYGLFTDAGG